MNGFADEMLECEQVAVSVVQFESGDPGRHLLWWLFFNESFNVNK